MNLRQSFRSAKTCRVAATTRRSKRHLMKSSEVPLKALLADPDQPLIEGYCDFLRQAGLDVAIASSGEECLQRIRSWKPNVLVLEPESPDCWGDHVLQETRQLPGRDRPFIVVLTRDDRRETDGGVFASFLKPLSLNALVQAIDSAAGPSASKQRASSEVAGP